MLGGHLAVHRFASVPSPKAEHDTPSFSFTDPPAGPYLSARRGAAGEGRLDSLPWRGIRNQEAKR